MKKVMLILAISILPTLLMARDCYTDWLRDYDSARIQFQDDVRYCRDRMIDFWSFHCGTFAAVDYHNRLNDGFTRYEKCLFGY